MTDSLESRAMKRDAIQFSNIDLKIRPDETPEAYTLRITMQLGAPRAVPRSRRSYIPIEIDGGVHDMPVILMSPNDIYELIAQWLQQNGFVEEEIA